MKYDDKKKNKALVYIAKDMNIKDIQQELGISLSTLYRWKKSEQQKIMMIKTSLNMRNLMKKNENDQALAICEEEECQNDGVVQSQKITLLMRMNTKESIQEALSICNKEEFQNNEFIQSQKIKILLKINVEENLQEVLAICNREEFKDNKIINKQKKYALLLLKYFKSIKAQLITVPLQFLKEIKKHQLSLSEIESLDISDWNKMVLTCAFYDNENYSKKMILDYLKSQIQVYMEDENALKGINKLKSKLEQKSSFFDMNFYKDMLDYNVYLPKKQKKLQRLKKKLEENLDIYLN